MTSRFARKGGVLSLLISLAFAVPLSAQEIAVTSATPASAEQGTISLDVRIGGKGFRRGATARFLRAGTEDPDGIVVNSTTYVSGSELVANITVSSAASISTFDIEVLSSGRKGKGTEMFSVTAPNAASAGGATCTLPASDPDFTLVTTLNAMAGAGPQVAGGFGVQVAARRGTLPPDPTPGNVLIAAIGSASSSYIEMLVLDPITGTVQRRFSVRPDPALVLGTRSLAAGEINGDDLPDFALGDPTLNVVFALVSNTSSGQLAYDAVRVPRPSSPGTVGWELTLGDLDGDGRDELALGVDSSGSGRKAVPTSIHVFTFAPVSSAPALVRVLSLPGPAGDAANARAFAIADVDGVEGNDLIVGVGTKDAGATKAGAVYVFTNGSSLAATLTAETPLTDDGFGRKVRAGDVDGDGIQDVVVATGWMGSNIRADVVPAAVTSASKPVPALVMRPVTGLDAGWATSNPSVDDLDGDGRADVIVGAPNATVGRCTSPGVAYVFRQTADGVVRHTLWAPTADPDFAAFGWSVASAAGSAVILVAEHGRDVGGVRNAGQVYVYRFMPQ